MITLFKFSGDYSKFFGCPNFYGIYSVCNSVCIFRTLAQIVDLHCSYYLISMAITSNIPYLCFVCVCYLNRKQVAQRATIAQDASKNIFHGKVTLFKFSGDYSKFFGCPNFYGIKLIYYCSWINMPSSKMIHLKEFSCIHTQYTL